MMIKLNALFLFRQDCCCNLIFNIFFFHHRRAIEIDEEEDDKNVMSVPSHELNAAISELSLKLENLRTCNDLISKNGRALQSALAELEIGEDLANKTKQITERATLFRISSNAMINVSDCTGTLGFCCYMSFIFFNFSFLILSH